MNNYDKLHNLSKVLRENYPKGTRVQLISMNDERAVPEGTKGTVRLIDDMATIHVDWDNGQTLGLIYGEDSFKKIE
jgi:hypothetical protein